MELKLFRSSVKLGANLMDLVSSPSNLAAISLRCVVVMIMVMVILDSALVRSHHFLVGW